MGTGVLAAQNPTQSSPPPDGTMRELVAEVRALRLAAKLSTDLAEMVRRLQGSSGGADERASIDAMLREMRGNVKLAEDQAAQLRADEQAVLTALTQEQTRWSDYNARLEAIEEDFARPPSRLP